MNFNSIVCTYSKEDSFLIAMSELFNLFFSYDLETDGEKLQISVTGFYSFI